MDIVRLGGGDRLAEEVDEDDHGERKVDPAPTFAHAGVRCHASFGASLSLHANMEERGVIQVDAVVGALRVRFEICRSSPSCEIASISKSLIQVPFTARFAVIRRLQDLAAIRKGTVLAISVLIKAFI